MNHKVSVINIQNDYDIHHKTHESVVAIDALVHGASKYIVPVWPIETFIACNPLQGYEDEPFDEAFKKVFQMQQTQSSHAKKESVNREMIKWSGAFLDIGQGTIEMPLREQGFYKNFCTLALFDYPLHSGDQSIKEWLSQLPESPQEAIRLCLRQLGIQEDNYHDFLVQNFSYLPGWAGYVKWLSTWSNNTRLSIDLVQYIAVRLILTKILWTEIKYEKKNPCLNNHYLNQLETIKQNENEYSNNLIQKIKDVITSGDKTTATPDIQMVFCIDVRSEPFRKKLESLGAYETLGFAGFFGLPVRIHDYNRRSYKDCCPVLLKPRFNIYKDINTSNHKKDLLTKRQDLLDSFIGSYQQLKYNYTTPFNLADAMGPWSGMAMFLRNFCPKPFQNMLDLFQKKMVPDEKKQIKISIEQISHEEQISYADTILRLMGLTQNFAKVVVFCGHKSTTTNNPYASALDCGACGGNHGSDNAKILAQILNQPFVRHGLSDNGIHIPKDTLFISATHDTTTDECELDQFEHKEYANLLNKFQIHLKETQQKNLEYRCQYFNEDISNMETKSCNWSEVRPEWGLARNAAFIVGPRALTKNIDLDGRCFLHSYHWKIDHDGKLLETILTAPMVVAQWINSQYLFSTLDNVNFGSGSKITHNVVGKIGIMQGNGSDLMHGLALQSVKSNDDESFHIPQRLLTIVHAPRQQVMEIVSNNEILQKLFYNQWVHLVVLDPDSSRFYQLERNKYWKAI